MTGTVKYLQRNERTPIAVTVDPNRRNMSLWEPWCFCYRFTKSALLSAGWQWAFSHTHRSTFSQTSVIRSHFTHNIFAWILSAYSVCAFLMTKCTKGSQQKTINLMSCGSILKQLLIEKQPYISSHAALPRINQVDTTPCLNTNALHLSQAFYKSHWKFLLKVHTPTVSRKSTSASFLRLLRHVEE